MTPEKRSAIDNGIWLCSDCATEIDVNKGKYPIPLLQDWKRQAELTAGAEKGKRQPQPDDGRSELVSALTGAPTRFTRTAIGNTHGAVEQVLHTLDPRLRVETSYSNKTTFYTVRALEDVGFKMNVPAPLAKEWAEGMQRLIDHGKDAKLPATGVAMTGSPLLEQLFAKAEMQTAHITVADQKKLAVQKLTLVDPTTHQSEQFDDIQGQVAFGRKSMTFDGTACAGVLQVSFTMHIGGKAGPPTFNMALEFEGWHSHDVRHLPYFDKLRRLIDRLRAGWRMDIELEIDGLSMLRGAVTLPADSDALTSSGGALEYISLLRKIAPHLTSTISFAYQHPITQNEFSNALEVAQITEGRVFGKADMATAPETTVVALGSNIDEILRIPAQDFSMLWIEEGGELHAFGQALPLPKRETRLERARPKLADEAFDLAAIVDGDEVRMKLEPAEDFRCSVRFLPPAEEPLLRDHCVTVPAPPPPRAE
jgi:hypothetical protein